MRKWEGVYGGRKFRGCCETEKLCDRSGGNFGVWIIEMLLKYKDIATSSIPWICYNR